MSDYFGPPDFLDPDKDFWESRPILRHIHQSALARGTGPWSVLLNVLINTAAHVRPGYTLPAIVGSRQPLNLIGVAVGGSGVSKDASRDVANETLLFPDLEPIPIAPLGSAQGITKVYQRFVPPSRSRQRARGEDEPPESNDEREKRERAEKGYTETLTDRAIFVVPEVNSIGALADSSGTLRDQIKLAWSGSVLGYAYAGEDKRNILAAKTYRFCMIVGAQPSESNWLLSGEGDGFPQRLLWLPASNRYGVANVFEKRPIREIVPEMPEPITWLGLNYHPPKPGEFIDFRIPPEIEDTIRRKVAQANLSINGSGIDGHRLQGIERVAIVFACLENRIDVSTEDWELAEKVYAKSDETLEDIKNAIAEKENNRRSAVATERAVTDSITDDMRGSQDESRIEQTIERVFHMVKAIPLDEGLMRSTIRRGLTANLRRYIDTAIEQLTADGAVHSVLVKAANGIEVEKIRFGRSPD